MKRLIAASLAVIALGCALPTAAQQRPTPESNGAGVLFWSPADRERAFRAMDDFGPHAPVSRGDGQVRALPQGAPLNLDPTAYMQDQRVAGSRAGIAPHGI